MSGKYQPTEAQIAEVLKRFTPRQIAIAYLRKKREAATSALAFGAYDSIVTATDKAKAGDLQGAKDSLTKLQRMLRTHKQNTE